MKINRLYIKNFRGFGEKEFHLNPSFTVAIGNNGTGKSTLLHAMQVATGTFFLGLPYVNRRHIEENEIRFAINKESKQSEHFTPTIVEATGFINGSGVFTWRREIQDYGKPTSGKDADVGKIKRIAEGYAKGINNPERPMLPVIAFFGVKQLGGTIARRTRTKKDRIIIRDGYYNSLGAKSDEAAFTQWFYYYQENLAADMEFKGTFEAVIKAIEKSIPYLKNVSFDNYRLELVADCEIEGQQSKRLPHSLMSDGVKRMLGIVTDIAYRCVVLNGFKEDNAVEETKGIVMIDELDMHLHPNWQRHVVADLKNAFPNIQFVVTTHSPFIVQSLQNDELINLDENPVSANPSDLTLNKVVTDIMGVEEINADDFLKRHETALKAFELLKLKNHTPVMDDYMKIKQLLDGILPESTTDPVYKAFIEATKE